MACGVTIGKFYPPHLGHSFLIESALSQCDDLTVIVCDHPMQKISGELRAAWLRELHPSARVVVTPDDEPDEPAPWAKRTLDILGRRPDKVFSSEEYGHNYAAMMGAQHVCVDIDRAQVPISATAIRRDPYSHWEFLSPPLRGFFALRVVLIGVESTGKTTLAQQLANHYQTNWVPEYGRDYAAEKVAAAAPWVSDDFVTIARTQQITENEMARDANRVLICDTNAFATSIWHERYMEERSAKVEEISNLDQVDLYLLAVPDFPFVQDGTRDGEHIRDWMHERFLARLAEMEVPVVTLNGNEKLRLSRAIHEIDQALKTTRRI